MKYLYYIFFIIISTFFLQFFISCNNKDDFPVIYTGDVTDIDSTSVLFHAYVENINYQEQIEIGFVWGSNPEPTIANGEKYIIRNPKQGEKHISQRIQTALIPEKINYVRAFIKTNQFIVYGKNIKFLPIGSDAPLIEYFSPQTANIGDTIVITGNFFSSTNTKVFFSEKEADILYVTQDTIITTVPQDLSIQQSPIKVGINNYFVETNYKFHLKTVTLTDFQEKEGTYNANITITGKSFHTHVASLKVFFEHIESDFQILNDSTIQAQIPSNINVRNASISVSMNNIPVFFKDSIKLTLHSISNISHEKIQTGQNIVISGERFSPIKQHNIVRIGGLPAQVITASSNSLQVKVPFQTNTRFEKRNAEIEVEIAGTSLTHKNTIEINDQWFKMKEAPTSFYSPSHYYRDAVVFVYNSKAYIGLNNNQNFQEFDPLKNEWKKLADFPGVIRSRGNGFVIDDKIYFGMGYQQVSAFDRAYLNDWWEYDITLNKWTKKSNFPLTPTEGQPMGFSFKNKGFLLPGTITSKSTIYNYDHENNVWIDRSSLSVKYQLINYNWSFAIPRENDVVLGHVRHYGFKVEKGIYIYKPDIDTNVDDWRGIPQLQISYYNEMRFSYFYHNNSAYVLPGQQRYLFYYSDESNTWKSIELAAGFYFDGGIGFSINGKIYLGMGPANTMWEFDQNR
ncbi:MAG: IPT/TIG domain-containing protein, partial [Paludibacter sp.]|nr:IPT/TIG domain-containing protein [Paludibacter sp.]